MARYRDYDRRQVFFNVVQPEKILEENPLLRAVDEFFEKANLEEFDEKVENDQTGAPAIDPRLLLKVIFYSYAIGVYSMREMEERITWDQNYMVLTCQQRVDYSTISRFIGKYSQQIEGIFSKLLYVLLKAGMISRERIAIDGTKIEANVSGGLVPTVEEYSQKKEHIAGKVAALLRQTSEEEKDANRDKQQKKVKQLEHLQEKIEQFLQQSEQAEDSDPKRKIHLTDPDARMMKGHDGFCMAYNGQAAVDTACEIILAADLVNEETDVKQFQPMIEEIEQQTGELSPQAEILVDAGYFSSENLQFANQQQLQAYIPEGKADNGSKKRNAQTIESRDCQLEIDGDIRRLICPGGQRMETTSTKRAGKGYDFYMFYPEKRLCLQCSLFEKCYSNVKSRKTFKVKKEYFDSLHIRHQMQQRLSTSYGKDVFKNRSIIERVFAQIKQNYHFRRFLHRGLQKVRTIWKIVCAAYNFRRIAALAYT